MASYTNPILHATGDDLAITDWNGLANDVVFLAQRPYFNYFNSVATSVSNGTITQVTLGGTTASGYGFSVSSNNVVVPLTGTYMLGWAVWFANGGGAVATSGDASSTMYTTISHNGSGVLNGSTTFTTQPIPASSGSGLVACTTGDTLSLQVFQDMGGTVNTQTGAAYTYISGFFVGSQ